MAQWKSEIFQWYKAEADKKLQTDYKQYFFKEGDPSANKYNDDCLAMPVKPNHLLAYKNINIRQRQRQKHMPRMQSDPWESDERQFQNFLW